VRLLRRTRLQRGTPRSRRAERFLAAGAQQSRTFGHDYVGTEHVLLALTEDPSSPAAQVLGRLGLTGDVVRRDIERIIGTAIDPRRRAIDPDALATLGIDLVVVSRRVEETFGAGALESARSGALDRPGGPYRCIAPRLKKALELAATEAGDCPVRPEHMLVSLAAVEDCIAARILGDHGVTVTALREALTKLGEDS
jgi:ATP-dependent Clp protease ATP-binding subunit ClpA